MRRFRPSRLGLVGVATLVVAAIGPVATAPAAGQELSGRALGPDGEPLGHIPVVLHRVGEEGGAFVATDTTNPEGRFRFMFEADDSAVHFVALRYEDRMYIGPAVHGGGDPGDYVVRVEPGSEAGAIASALSGPRSATPAGSPTVGAGAGTARGSDEGAFILVGLLALAATGAFLIAAPRYRRNRTRDALIELATAENALAGGDDPEERARWEAIRDRLRKQLAPGR